MKPCRTTLTLTVAALLVVAAAPALAQTNALEQTLVPHTFASGVLENLTAQERVVFSEVINAGDVPWMRLTFRRAVLGEDSYLRLTSLLDGGVQHLTPAGLMQWRNTSAYFNGSQVRVELVAGPGSTGNLLEVGDLWVGAWSDGVPETQCGPTDDRVSSDEPDRARLLDIGCTASIYTVDSCFISAGHCVSTPSLLDVVEFNVPPSMPNGTIVHPGPEDQYAVDTSSTEFVNGGVGNDWGLFMVFPNSETGLLPFEAQGSHVVLADQVPDLPNDIEVVGYGVDDGVDNQTQQRSTGPLTLSIPTQLSYQADTEGGNSGSAVILLESGEVVAVHTHGGCSGGGGANSGTGIENAGLQAALADFCPQKGGDGVPCGDVMNFQARCVAGGPGNRLQARVTLTDTSHDGETVTIAVDGVQEVLTINGRRALFTETGVVGSHTISLEDPAACLPDIVVNCP